MGVSESVASDYAAQQWRTYHCGVVSSHLMCLFLHVLQPSLDFVWLLLDCTVVFPEMEEVDILRAGDLDDLVDRGERGLGEVVGDMAELSSSYRGGASLSSKVLALRGARRSLV